MGKIDEVKEDVVEETNGDEVSTDEKQVISDIIGFSKSEKEQSPVVEEEVVDDEEDVVEEEVEKEEEVKPEEVVEKKEDGKKEEVKEEEEKEEEKDEDKLFSEIERLSGLLAKEEESLMSKGKDFKPEDKKVEDKKEEEKEEVLDEEKAEEKVVDEDRLAIDKAVDSKEPYQDQQFLKPDAFEGVMESEEVSKLNKAINTAVKLAINSSRKQALYDGMEVFPNIIDKRVRTLIAVQEFWRENSDIKNLCTQHPKFRNYVSRLADEIQAKNNSYTLEEIFDETAKEVRRVLGEERMKKFESDSVDSRVKAKRPALASKPTHSGHRKPTKSAKVPSDLDDIKELIEFGKEL
jgi:hypothetical protein